MPFKSKAQAKYLTAKKPKVAKEFASKTKDMGKLPKKVEPKKNKKAPTKPKQQMLKKDRLEPIEKRRKMK